MPNTYSRIVFHVIFAVKYREALITKDIKTELEKYLCALFANRDQKVLAISCMPDHVHILYSHRLSIHIPDLIKEVKVASTLFIRSKLAVRKPFYWQSGYAIFSCWADDLKRIIQYIQNQEEHHRKKDFLSEYRDTLTKNEVTFDEAYIFRTPEE